MNKQENNEHPPAQVRLTPEELHRYRRQTLLATLGEDGQKRIKGARVLIVGVGGLGSPASVYLAAAGVGTIGLVDFDVVELSNLQRQTLYGTSDVGLSKMDVASKRLRTLNPHVSIHTHEVRLSEDNAARILGEYDIVIDGVDNFPARYLINDTCVQLGTPYIHGSVSRFEGQATVFDAVRGPCYRCLFPDPPPGSLAPPSAEVGIIGTVPGIIGTIEASEAIKLIIGAGNPLIGRLLVFDMLEMKFREVAIEKNPACPVCGKG